MRWTKGNDRQSPSLAQRAGENWGTRLDYGPADKSRAGRPLDRRRPAGATTSSLVLLCALVLAFVVLSGAAPEKRLSVYSLAANYSLELVQRGGHEYVGLLELLEPLGHV